MEKMTTEVVPQGGEDRQMALRQKTEAWVGITGQDLPKEASQVDAFMLEGVIDAYMPHITQLEHVLSLANDVVVNGEDDAAGMAHAKRVRIAHKNLRNEIERARKGLKDGINVAGRLVDGLAKQPTLPLEQNERKLLELEQTAERAEAARRNALRLMREEQLRPFVENVTMFALDTMTDEAFDSLLTGSKLAHEKRIQDAAEAENKRKEEAAAEAKRIEEMRKENERLARAKQEAEAETKRLRQAEADRQRVEAKKAAEQARQAAEMQQAGKDKERLAALREKLLTFAGEIPVFDDATIREGIVERLAAVFEFISDQEANL